MARSSPPPLPLYSQSAIGGSDLPDSTPLSYDAQGATVDPPRYAFPSRFKIGKLWTDLSLVEIPAIRGHLSLLRAFADLKDEVLNRAPSDVEGMPSDGERRWAWFVGLAAERFNIWCRALHPKHTLKPIEEVLPPLDVLMVWHSYMLNPRWYAEDGQRVKDCKVLFQLGTTLGKILPDFPNIVHGFPSQARIEEFEQLTGVPFFHFQSAREMVEKQIECPKCTRAYSVPYMTPSGTGYLQQGFKFQCRSYLCLPITKDTLCARKLAENLSRVEVGTPMSFLPGTYFTNSSDADQKKSKSIVSHARSGYTYSTSPDRISSAFHEDLRRMLLNDTGYSVAKLRAKLGKDAKLIGRIMSAHSTPMNYSIDLVGAVMRQGGFIEKMVGLGWTTQPNAQIDVVLQHALARYHAFLDLMSSAPASFFVPTLDIDLVWHTHQLSSVQYRSDCETYVGRFVDHDDKVDAPKLSSSFDLTSRAWQDRFNTPYTYCGCPPPGQTITQRFSRLLSSKGKEPADSSTPPVIAAERPDAQAATHPSEHNAVQFRPQSKRSLKNAQFAHREVGERMARREQRKLQEEQERRKEKKGDDAGVWCGYGVPFIMPVPLFYGPVAVGGGGCAAVHSAIVDHGGACGNGNGLCGGGGCSAGGCGTAGCGGGCGGGGGSGGCGGCGGGGCGG